MRWVKDLVVTDTKVVARGPVTDATWSVTIGVMTVVARGAVTIAVGTNATGAVTIALMTVVAPGSHADPENKRSWRNPQGNVDHQVQHDVIDLLSTWLRDLLPAMSTPARSRTRTRRR